MKNTQIVFAALTILASTAAHAANCVNFSGSWQGTCNTNGQVSNDQIDIQQSGCEQINLGGLVSVIGSVKTYTKTQGNVTTTVKIATQWNADRTQLPGRLQIVTSQAGQPGKTTDLYTGMGMNGSKLIIAAKSSDGSVVQCVYDKR